MKKQLIMITMLLTFIFLVSCTTSGTEGTTDTGNYEAELALAECLTESGAHFYGAYWCPHCEEQRDMFGDAKDALPYIECEENQEVCAAAGITGYPTWIFADGTVVQGGQSFEALAEYTGCEYAG